MVTCSPPAWDRAVTAFQSIWGYDSFRPPQDDIIRTLLDQRDALIVLPTGGGKSLCFQLPALLQTGVTLVVSPLVALMENQVEELRSRRLPAATVHSQIPSFQRRQTLQAVAQNRLRLLYLSPETLLSPAVWETLCQPQVQINGLILDEAHCLVQWGDTFRPTYRRLGTVRPALLKTKPAGTQIPIAAFTATANPIAQKILQDVLGLVNPKLVRLSPYRQNLHLAVQTVWTPRGRRRSLLKFLQQYPGQSGLVYVRTQRDAEDLAQWLCELGYRARGYHAGLGAGLRRQIEADWIQDRTPIVVCTSAFGMGINKPNVRFVAHYQAPCTLSEYVQEIGRGGRNGERSDALTLVSEPTEWFDSSDKQRRSFFAQQQQKQIQKAQQLVKQIPKTGNVQQIKRQFPHGPVALSLLHAMGKLTWDDPFSYRIQSVGKGKSMATQDSAMQEMNRFLRHRGCRWQKILQDFGCSTSTLGKGCGHCDRCKSV